MNQQQINSTSLSRKRSRADFEKSNRETAQRPSTNKRPTRTEGYETDFVVPAPPTSKKRKLQPLEEPASKSKVAAKNNMVITAKKEPRSNKISIPSFNMKDGGYQTEAIDSRPRRSKSKPKKDESLSSSEEETKNYSKQRQRADGRAQTIDPKSSSRQKPSSPRAHKAQKAPINSCIDIPKMQKMLRHDTNGKNIAAHFKPVILLELQQEITMLGAKDGIRDLILGPVIDMKRTVISSSKDHHQVDLRLKSFEIFGNTKSDKLKLEVGKMIDFSITLNQKHPQQIRPKSKFLFITEIKLSIQLKENISFNTHIHVMPVLGANNVKNDQICQNAIKKILNQFGQDSFSEKSQHCVVSVPNFEDCKFLTLLGVALDRKRLRIASVCSELNVAKNSREQADDRNVGKYQLKYGFDYKDTDTLQYWILDESTESFNCQYIQYKGDQQTHVSIQEKKVSKKAPVKKEPNPNGHQTDFEMPISRPKPDLIANGHAQSSRQRLQAQNRILDEESSQNDDRNAKKQKKSPIRPQTNSSNDALVQITAPNGVLAANVRQKVKPIQTKQYESEAEQKDSPVAYRKKHNRNKVKSQSSQDEQSVMVSKQGQIQAAAAAKSDQSSDELTRHARCKRPAAQTDVEEFISKNQRNKKLKYSSESRSDQSQQKSRNVKATKNTRNNKQNSTIQEVEQDDSNAVMQSYHSDDQDSDEEPDQFKMLRNQNQPMIIAKNMYDVACQKLQLNAVPDQLPCREKERKQIVDYICNGLKNKGSSSSLYISGMPGTGKTATTLEVIESLKKNKKLKFDFLHINAMQLTNPNLVYTIIYQQIVGVRVAPASAALFLDEFFKKKDKAKVLVQARGKNIKKSSQDTQKECDMMRVILIDELDALVTQKQTLLYNLFDWPCHQNSRLLVVSIANTMDLPERMQQKISSRIGNNRLVYEPYTLQQILTILKSRLKDVQDIFDGRSLDFVARKVSMYSGDIRRSLQIAKRSVEICRERHYQTHPLSTSIQDDEITKVVYQDVISAFDELFNSKTVQVLQSLQRHEIVVMLALFSELEQCKTEKVLMDDVQDKCNTILKQISENKIYKIQTHIYREIVKRLQAFGLVTMQIEHQKITENVFLQMTVFKDDIYNGFKLVEWVQNAVQGLQALKELFSKTKEAEEMVPN